MEAYRCDFKQQQRSALQNLVEDLSVISLLSLIKCWNKWYLWIFFSEVHTVWLYLCKGFLRELYYTDHDSTKCYEYTHKFVQLSLGRGLKQSPTFFFFNCRTSEKLECVCVCVCARARACAHMHMCTRVGITWIPRGQGSRSLFLIHVPQVLKAVAGTPVLLEWINECVKIITFSQYWQNTLNQGTMCVNRIQQCLKLCNCAHSILKHLITGMFHENI